MIAPDVWKQLVATLKGSGLLTYVNNVFEGFREVKDEASLPCLMLEPTQNGEIEKRTNQTMDLYLNVDVWGFSQANYVDFERSIAGDEVYKGILDIESDLTAVLARSYNLGDTVIDVRLGTSEFDTLQMGKYPVRGFRMPIKILYRKINEA